MTDLTDIDVSGSKLKRYVLAGILVAVLAAGAYVVFRLATDDPGAAACEHLADLRATDPHVDDAIDVIVKYVETNFVRDRLVEGKEPVEVTGDTGDERCRSALRLLDRGLSHGPFTRKVDCVKAAKTAADAARCF